MKRESRTASKSTSVILCMCVSVCVSPVGVWKNRELSRSVSRINAYQWEQASLFFTQPHTTSIYPNFKFNHMMNIETVINLEFKAKNSSKFYVWKKLYVSGLANCLTSSRHNEQMAAVLSGKAVCVHRLTEGVVDPISLLLDLFIQPLHILHQQGHHLTLQLQTQTGEVQSPETV